MSSASYPRDHIYTKTNHNFHLKANEYSLMLNHIHTTVLGRCYIFETWSLAEKN